MSNLIAKEYKLFEAIKHLSEDGHEFWYARELTTVLEYVQWRDFIKVLDRAMLACKNSGYEIMNHFAEVSKTITMPKTATADAANEIHFIVGREVRGTSERVGGTMPEDLPTPTKSISDVERNQLKNVKKSP